jgi:hypothetical protein
MQNQQQKSLPAETWNDRQALFAAHFAGCGQRFNTSW